MKIYYGRPVTHYKSNRDRNKVIRAIYGWFYGDVNVLDSAIQIIDPDHPDHQEGYKQRGMDYFRELVATCNVGVFQPMYDGAWTPGVIAEAKVLRDLGRSIFTVVDGQLQPLDLDELDYILTVEQTRGRIALGLR